MGWFADTLGPFRGFAVTLRQMTRPRVTNPYPSKKREKPQRFHGRHVLNRYEDGMEKCIGCELCAGVCPARCIYVRGADNPPDAPVSPGERFGFIYEINMLRCIFCGLCVEACPTEAITMTHLFEMSVDNRDDAIYTRDELLVDIDGTPNHPQADNPLIDLKEAQDRRRVDAGDRIFGACRLRGHHGVDSLRRGRAAPAGEGPAPGRPDRGRAMSPETP